jgi:hypothetical protein
LGEDPRSLIDPVSGSRHRTAYARVQSLRRRSRIEEIGKKAAIRVNG